MTGASKLAKSVSPKGLHQPENPLEIDLVLTLIFSYASVEDLKAVRLVNPQWLQNSRNFWRKKAVVKVTHARRNLTDRMSIHRLNRKYTNPDEKHFLNMKWRNNSLPLTQICRRSLAPLTYLELDYCTLRGATGFLKLLSRVPLLTKMKLTRAAIFAEAPNASGDGAALVNQEPHQKLTRLEISLLTTSEARKGFQNLLVAALPLLPNLESILVKSDFFEHMLGFEVAMAELQPQQHLRLRTLDVLELAGSNLMNGYNLHYFGVTLEEYCTNITQFGLKPFVEGDVCSSLRKIRLSMMPILHILDIENFLVDGSRVSFPILEDLTLEMGKSLGFRFLREVDMPVLSRLELLEYKTDLPPGDRDRNELPQIENPPLPFVQLPNLKVLKIDLGMDYVEIPELQRLCEAMPMLEELEMCLTKDTFPVVCKHWKRLRVLKVLALGVFALEVVALDDEAVTGRREGKELVSTDNITSLERLMYFTLEMSEVVGNLTDVSVKHGFLKLKYLYRLEFCMDEVSAEARKLLQDSVPVLKESRRSPRT